MNEFMTNPCLFMATVIWVVCGMVSIFKRRDSDYIIPLIIASIASFLLGMGYLMAHVPVHK